MADPTLGYKLARQGVNLAERKTDSAPFNYRYPLKKIDKSDDYLHIQVLKYKPPGIGNQPSSFALNTSDQTYQSILKTDILGNIILPIPDNLRDSNTVSWGSPSINPLVSGTLAATDEFMKNISGFGEKIGKGTSNLKDFILTGKGQDVTASMIAGYALKQAGIAGGTDFMTVATRTTGLVANQNLELLFNGIAIRPEFSFGYDLVPRSQEEAGEIKNIIRKLKYHSSAKKGAATGPGAGLFLSTPDVFKITYRSGNKDHPFLNRFKICALLGMSVDYAASGTYSTYPDATPTHMKLALTFKELTPIYAEDYDALDKKGDTTVGY